ncbi:MAG: protein TolQ [Thermodesulfobacteriota bacterium]
MNIELLGGEKGSLLQYMLSMDPVVAFVLVLLLFFSVMSWAIIIYKYRFLKKAGRQSRIFSRFFREGSRLDQIYQASLSLSHSPLAETYRAGYRELIKIGKNRSNPGPEGENLLTEEIRGMDNLSRSVKGAEADQTMRLERALGFLATTGSICPFIGLFGTVWGIMSTFKSIGITGQATLAVVAPGISEALVATAAGLAAAIPAVVGYNYYTNRINRMAVELANFVNEFLNLVERNLSKRV